MNLQNITRLPSAGCLFLLFSLGHSAAQTLRVPTHYYHPPKQNKDGKGDKSKYVRGNCWLFPTLGSCMPSDDQDRMTQINSFFNTGDKLSYFNQIKSIYNGASGSTTMSADVTSLNFLNGMQITAVANVQAGPSNATPGTTGGLPNLSTTGAGQAVQNMLYGGTIVASADLPAICYVSSKTTDDPGGLGLRIDLVARQGVDVQNFNIGTSATASAPPAHTDLQVQGYLQYNSTNMTEAKKILGAVFLGGSYGYNYTSHGYARAYGFPG